MSLSPHDHPAVPKSADSNSGPSLAKLVARCWLKSWLRMTNFSTWTSPTTPSALRRPTGRMTM